METMSLLKKCIELSETDLVENLAWASYYEPDEIELLDQLGLDSGKLLEALKSVQYSDDFVFAIPPEGATLPFKYIYLSAKVTTCGGNELVGYRTRNSLAVLHKGRWYQFNKAVLSLSIEQASHLRSALGVKEVFPLTVQLPALSKTEIYLLSAEG
jgi:hypothetical protein